MAQFTLHAYDADVWVPEFRGLNQADVMLNPDLRYAAEAENVETPNGILQPQAALGVMNMEENLDGKIETLCAFHRRWYKGSGSKDWYVCCSEGKFYFRQANSLSPWQAIELPVGVDAYQSSVWSWVTYEINPVDQNEEPLDTVDVLVLTNGLDGMIMIIPPDKPTSWTDVKEQSWEYYKNLDMTWLDVKEPAWHINTIDTRADPEDPDEEVKKFGVIERYAERIWAGDITGHPDMLVYSRAFDPTDWSAAGQDEQPEDGAGEINIPSWDGDKIYALRRYGDRLLVLKKNKIWLILGTSPGEFSVQEQYAVGTSFFNTVVVHENRVFMETVDGLSLYDGSTATPYAREQIEQIWKTVNKSAMDQMCAAIFQNRLYVAIPTGASDVNNALLVYNLIENTILYYTNICVESFLPTDEYLFATGEDGRVIALTYNSWDIGYASGKATKWVSPWIDFGYKRIQKGGFDLYFIPEVKDKAVTLTFSIQTEKKKKTKSYTVQPLTEAQLENEKKHRGKRLHFGGTGRKFRVIIETDEGITSPWRLIGGLQLVVETDPD